MTGDTQMSWTVEPSWLGRSGRVEEVDEGLRIACDGGTDWFCDPRERSPIATAPALVVSRAEPPVIVAAQVVAAHDATFDAAGLLVHFTDTSWVKLAVERSPQGSATIVSVVTNGASDDCNHLELDEPRCELRVAVDEASVALHVRTPGTDAWRLVRYAPRPAESAPAIGLLVQSPTGNGTSGDFTQLRVTAARLAELRDGS